MDDQELAGIARLARQQKMTTAEWVRQVLRTARRTAPHHDGRKKIEVVRAAARHSFPTADIDQMLSEIEQGYTHTASK